MSRALAAGGNKMFLCPGAGWWKASKSCTGRHLWYSKYWFLVTENFTKTCYFESICTLTSERLLWLMRVWFIMKQVAATLLTLQIWSDHCKLYPKYRISGELSNWLQFGNSRNAESVKNLTQKQFRENLPTLHSFLPSFPSAYRNRIICAWISIFKLKLDRLGDCCVRLRMPASLGIR